jgi:hypothetical protein
VPFNLERVVGDPEDDLSPDGSVREVAITDPVRQVGLKPLHIITSRLLPDAGARHHLFSEFPQTISRRSLAMPDEQLPINASTLEVQSILKELEVPFSPNQVQWRVTNTAKDRKRAQVVPYADPRAYTDRLNALFTP